MRMEQAAPPPPAVKSKMQQNKRNLVTALILAAIAIGIFLYTLMNASP